MSDMYELLKNKEEESKKSIYLPKTLDLANSLFLAYVRNNNLVGLKLSIMFSGARGQIEYDENNRARFEVTTLCDLLNITKKDLSRNLKKVLDVGFDYVTNEGEVGRTTPIHSYEYRNRSKEIYIEVSSKAKSLFTELEKGKYSFNQANAQNLMNLKHKHSIRMQLLIEHIGNFDDKVAKRKRYTLEQLNGYFGVNYKNYYELERRILKPAKEEINKSCKLGFKYELLDDRENVGVGRPRIKEVLVDIIDHTSTDD